jgi:hypothetical protein
MLEIFCSSLRICWESVSIFAFCSSIFFASACNWAASDEGAGVRADVWADAEEPSHAAKTRVPRVIASRLIALDFDIGSFFWQARQICLSRDFSVNFAMPERIQKPNDPVPWGPKQGDGGGPRSPDVSRPDTKDLLKKMRKVDPNQSKRYRQRTGQ